MEHVAAAGRIGIVGTEIVGLERLGGALHEVGLQGEWVETRGSTSWLKETRGPPA